MVESREKGLVIVCVVGTRPEAIKMAPVVLGLRRAGGLRVRLVSTGQHRELLDDSLAEFGLVADRDLGLMRPGQTLAEVTARALSSLDGAIAEEQPDLVLAQGDTTTVLASALASYYRKIPFGHVEAGLRTGQPYRPFPEEKNRVLAAHLAEVHFAPTARARLNLLREGIDDRAIHVTGNPGIDALHLAGSRAGPLPFEPETDRMILVTAHRRESFGAPLAEICRGLRDLVERDPRLCVVFPVHPNPSVVEAVEAHLRGQPRIRLVGPVGYSRFVALMRASFLILTDSGGVQEEGPSLGKPVLVLRDETERPEAIEAGTVQLVGPHRRAIVEAVEALARSPDLYRKFATIANPYGDGWAAERIVRIIQGRFGIAPSPEPPGFSAEWPKAR
ncbi:non-hydrolyzing UDP-N-acetylglucosamine 2-epimerase [Tundrisphaera lichenicola]|uniref:non-hydrolyzing UDP-N-acetylglucosamine 2-epimerase n=1 Tax=Tundrisphaera lichenicola TaxID=2029860 RepID=UPI003EBBCAD7